MTKYLLVIGFLFVILSGLVFKFISRIGDSSSNATPIVLGEARTYAYSTSNGISDEIIPTSQKEANVAAVMTALDDSYNKTNYSFTTTPSPMILQVEKPTPTPNFNNIPLPTLIAAVADYMNPSPTGVSEIPIPTTPIGAIAQNPKDTYIVAILGDSMVDTMGRDLRVFNDALKDVYSPKSFALLNYGFGSTDLESGLFRLTHHTIYLDKSYPALLSYRPDILVVESFAYNHWSGNQYDLDRQWLTLAKIVDTVKLYSPSTQIVLLSTIAPNPLTFGDGSLNWNATAKWEASQVIKSYLENMVRFALSQKLPLADAYHPTLDAQGYGMKLYINPGDNLHLSDEGRRFVSRKIVDAIRENKIIQ